jgi:hypothetical protein
MTSRDIESLAAYLSYMFGIPKDKLIGEISTWLQTPRPLFDLG